MPGTFDLEIDRRHSGTEQTLLTGRLTRAADEKTYIVSLSLSFEYRPHPETDELVRTRVLSGTLAPAGLSACHKTLDVPVEEGTPAELGANRIRLIQNFAEAAAAITQDGRPNERREATYYGLANLDGFIERVAAWQVTGTSPPPGQLLGYTRPFTPPPDLDLDDQIERSRQAMSAEAAAAGRQPSIPGGKTARPRAPGAGQGTA